MNENEFASKLRSEVERFSEGFRNASAAFLIWYLINFFRIGEQDAKDSVCDSQDSKGTPMNSFSFNYPVSIWVNHK